MAADRAIVSTVTQFQEDGPSFCRLLFHGQDEQRLEIPPEFLNHISEDESETAVLKDRSGEQWRVKVERSQQGVFLQGGWLEFMRDHLLGEGVFLLFRYEGNLQFTVKIFDKNGLERLDPFVPQTDEDESDDMD